MLKTLIKKQFMECFRSYFVNPKTGKSRSRGGIIGMFVMFAAIMLFLCAVFFGLAFMMGGQLFQVGMGWLYYVLMGSLAVILGVFGSVFNTYATLYLSKDNDLLLSLPIPPSRILITRMSLVYGLSLLYGGSVWLPAIVYAWIFGTVTPAAVVFQVLLLVIIALFVTVITCVLGWAVALVASKIKNKSFIVVLASLAFFGIYYYMSFNMVGMMEKLLMNAEAVGQGIRTWANILYQLGMAADGSVSSMLIFTGATLVLFGVCFMVLSRSFLHIATKTQAGAKPAGKISVKAGSTRAALNGRELRRFLSSPTYMLNCGLGVVFMLLLAVVAVIKRDMIAQVVSGLGAAVQDLSQLPPLLVVLAIGFCTGMDYVTAPSVSLEGKNLWIVRALPVSGKMVLRAKLGLGLRINLIPTALSAAVLGWCFGLEAMQTVLCALLLCAMAWFFSAFGLTIGILRPELQWTTETMPIKQSMNIFIAVLLAFALPLLVAGLGYLTRNMMRMDAYLAVAAAVLALGSLAMSRWLDTRGAARFEAL